MSPGFEDALARIVAAAEQQDLLATDRPADQPLPNLLGAGTGRYEGHIAVEEDGTFTQARGGASIPFEVPASGREELTELAALRDTLMGLLDAESRTSEDTEEIAALRAEPEHPVRHLRRHLRATQQVLPDQERRPEAPRTGRVPVRPEVRRPHGAGEVHPPEAWRAR